MILTVFQTLYLLRYVHEFHSWEIIFSLGISVGLLFILQKLMLMYATNVELIAHQNEGDRPQEADERDPDILADLMDDLISEPVLGDGKL